MFSARLVDEDIMNALKYGVESHIYQTTVSNDSLQCGFVQCKHYFFFFGLCADTPSQRVQFILGTEDDDLEHVPHDLFTELDELSFRDGRATEWRETARSGSNQRVRCQTRYNKCLLL